MTVKLGIVSDLHSEFWTTDHIEQAVRRTLADADAILLAGDIGKGRAAVQKAKAMFPDQPVFMVAGNHEFYNGDYDTVLHEMREEARHSNVSILHQDSRELWLGDTKLQILGVTLWTDFALYSNQPVALMDARRGLNDFRLIFYRGRSLMPEDTLRLHQDDRRWLQNMLAIPFDGMRVVMTHHAPVSFAISPRFVNDRLSPCFASAMEDFLAQFEVDLCVWGHTHHCVDRTIGSTRFLSCQTGYPRGVRETETAAFGQVIELGSAAETGE